MAALADRNADLRSERDRFVAFSFAAADLLLEVGADGLIRFASGAAHSMTGHDVGEILGKPYLSLFLEEDRRYVALLLERLKIGSRLESVMARLSLPEGESAAILGGCRLPGQEGILHLTLTTPHPGVLREGVAGLRDAVTGLLEKEAFEKASAETIKRHRAAEPNPKLTLLNLVALEGLRARAGGATTDVLLANMGALLRALSMGSDAAGRLTDDRFGFVHSETVDAANVSSQLQSMSCDADPSGQGLQIDYRTIDLALDGMTEEDAAKALVYTISKFSEARERNFPIASLTGAFRELLRETVAKIGALKGAVSEKRFDVAFQPIVDLSTRAVHHYELLARVDGGRSPYALVTFAEGVGLIEEFDLAICQRAIEFLRDPASGSLVVAVNLSGRSLESALFAQALTALLAPEREIRERLYFEITESTRITKLEQVNAVVQALRVEGHRFALDDFGAGASSFPYLHALTVDFVKIDGAYVGRMLSSSRDAAILKSIVALCRDLSVKTIAEMVETDEQAKRLEALGVDLAQGYMFGKPAPKPIELKRHTAPNVARPILRPGAKPSWS